jgi:hypothetical protein
MEASENHQKQSIQGSVRAIGNRLVVEHLEVEDERAARVVRERVENGHEPPATVRDAIEIGARVLEREGTAAEVDYVKAEFGRHATELAQSLVKSIETGNELLSEEIAKSFGADRQGTVQQQIKEMLDQAALGQREAISKQFSATDGSNPLSDFKDAVVRALKEADSNRSQQDEANRKRIETLTREIVELKARDEADRRVAEAEEAGTRKGRSFEERVAAAIEAIAGGRGDAATAVGDDVGTGGSKKGDVVVEIGAADGPSLGRIAFEVKDSQLTKPKAWSEMNGAMKARDAGFAVLVVGGEEKIPSGQQELHEYEGNKLIVAVDPEEPEGRSLELAYRYARCRLLVSREAELTVDAAGVRVAASEARALLEEARTIKSALTSARNSVDKARTGVEGMVAALIERLERIESLVSAAADADSAP